MIAVDQCGSKIDFTLRLDSTMKFQYGVECTNNSEAVGERSHPASSPVKDGHRDRRC